MTVVYLLAREDLSKHVEVGVSRHSDFLTKLTLKQPTDGVGTNSRATGKGGLRRDGLTISDRT